MYRTECTEWRLWRRERLERGGIHYYNHFTSLGKVVLLWKEEDRGEGEERWVEGEKKPLKAVSKSKAQLNFSTFIVFSHKHPEHQHNNQRHFSGVLVSPQRVCNILEVSWDVHFRWRQLTRPVEARQQSQLLTLVAFQVKNAQTINQKC